MRNNKQRRQRIREALQILADLGMPRAQQNERSALSLLAMLNITPEKGWEEAENSLVGITPIMDWIREHYKKRYAPNTRETVRRQTMHQFVEAGVSLYNPDKPDRPVNSPYAVYQVAPACLELVRSYGTELYKERLAIYLTTYKTLAQQYARNREMAMVPLHLSDSLTAPLSPGRHSELIRAIWEEFGPRFVPGGRLVYAGDTGDKWGYFDQKLFAELGLKIDSHGKMPDVIIYDSHRNWLILAEAVTSHGPVDAKRHQELSALFKSSKAGLVFVTVFPDRRTFTRYAELISWETEVWIADNPTHLIHFNGARFLGPYN